MFIYRYHLLVLLIPCCRFGLSTHSLHFMLLTPYGFRTLANFLVAIRLFASSVLVNGRVCCLETEVRDATKTRMCMPSRNTVSVLNDKESVPRVCRVLISQYRCPETTRCGRIGQEEHTARTLRAGKAEERTRFRKLGIIRSQTSLQKNNIEAPCTQCSRDRCTG